MRRREGEGEGRREVIEEREVEGRGGAREEKKGGRKRRQGEDERAGGMKGGWKRARGYRYVSKYMQHSTTEHKWSPGPAGLPLFRKSGKEDP